MKIFKILFIITMAAFVFCSCEYEWIQPEKKPLPENVSFSSDIMPIFNNGCNTGVCHGAGSTPPDLSEGNAYDALISGGYVDVETPEASILYNAMNSGSMKPYTSPGDADIVLEWIKQGAKDN